MSGAPKVIARFLAVGGAHVVVAGAVEDRNLTTACEGCAQSGGPYFPAEHETPEDLVRSALRAAQKHAEVCRAIPERVWQ